MLSTFKLDKLDSPGIAALLKSGPFAAAVGELAQNIASNLDLEDDVEVAVDHYTTDRAAASVTIRDPRGLLWQARDGVLTRAAANAGLEVRAR